MATDLDLVLDRITSTGLSGTSILRCTLGLDLEVPAYIDLEVSECRRGRKVRGSSLLCNSLKRKKTVITQTHQCNIMLLQYFMALKML